MIPLNVAYVIAGIAALVFAVVAAMKCARTVAQAWNGAGRFARYAFLAAALGLTLYGGAKGRIGGITFPFTDPEVRYIIDTGSYVTNDYVHVSFMRMIAPAGAPLMIDRRQVGQTNDVDWVNHLTTTFAQFANPSDIQFQAATNWDWIVYTTWTPGPTVQTNDVWHAYWGRDRNNRGFLIPIRTCVRDGSEIIATPKSRWDSEAE